MLVGSLVLIALLGCGGPAPTAAPPVPAGPRPDAAVAPARPDARREVPAAPEPLPPAWRCEDPASFPADCYVRLPGGTFLQGAQATDPSAPAYDAAARPDEGPPRRVTLPAYRLARHEVARSRYRGCVEAGWCAAADLLDPAWLDAPPAPAEERAVAVEGLTWEGAARVCAWLGGRLPTEAEWELGARGAEARRFPWGEAPRCGLKRLDDLVVESACATTGVQVFDQLAGATPEGFVGMAGNVWEWTADGYAPDAYAGGDAVDPRGPDGATARVQRGGGWTSTDPLELRSAARGSLVPDGRLPDVGVRCARDEAP